MMRCALRLDGARLGVLLSLLLSSAAQAATFTVTKPADTADGTCDADCSLREAIIAANANPGADIVSLPAGTYTLTLTGQPEEGALTGDLDITDTLTIDGAGQATTIIDGGGGPLDEGGSTTDRVFEIHQGVVVINGVTVQGGHPPVGSGGGIRNAGDLTISDSTVRNNVGRYGAGIMNGLYGVSDSNAPGGPVYGFSDISASGAALGLGDQSIALQDIGFDFTYYGRSHSKVWVASEGYLQFSDDDFSSPDNSNSPVPDGDGDFYDAVLPFWEDLTQGSGDVYVETQGSAPNRRFIVQFNAVEVNGKPITFQVILEEGTNAVLMQYAAVATDSETQGAGATVGIIGPEDLLGGVQYGFHQAVLSDNLAIRFTPVVGTLALNNVTVQGNDSTNAALETPVDEKYGYDIEGVGLYNVGSATVDASLFTGNLGEDPTDVSTGGNGGGIGNRGGSVTVTDSTISNNTAGQNGGGVSNRYGPMTLDNTVVSGNTVYCFDEPNGGGAANFKGDLIVRNASQIINNTLDTDGCDSSGGGIFSLFGTVLVQDSEVSLNVFTQSGANGAGGGVFARMGKVTIDNSAINDNQTSDGDDTGGGIDVVKVDLLVMNGSDVSGNINNTVSPSELESLGGGIRAVGSNLTISDSTLTDNDAGASGGGGIANVGYADYNAIDNKLAGGPTYAFDDIAGTGTSLTLGDNDAASVPIGFDFGFYDGSFTAVSIGSNGLLSFDNSIPTDFDPASTAFQCYDSNSAPNLSIFAFWDDLDPSSGGAVQYQTKGTAPNRQFIAQWTAVPFSGDPDAGTVTFQVILSETTNQVLVQYADVEQSQRARGASAAVAVESQNNYPGSNDSLGTGTYVEDTFYWSCDTESTLLTNGLAVLFGPTGNMSVSNATIDNNTAGDAGGAIFNTGTDNTSAELTDTTLSGNTPDCVEDDTGKLVSTINGAGQGSTVNGTCVGDSITLVAGNRSANGAEGDDFIRPSGGRQSLTGGPGTDTFGYSSVLQIGSVIMDFDTTAPEIIDVADLLTSLGYAGSDPLADGTLTFRNIGGVHTILMLDVDGAAGPATAKPYVTLLNVPSGNLSAANFAFGDLN